MTLYEAILLQPPFHFVKGYRFLVFPFGDYGKIMQVFKELLILLKRKNDSRLFALFVYDVLSL